MQRGSALFLAIALVFGAMVPFLAPTAARAVSDTVVVSQVYGGGGNSSATYTHDFIELFNRGTTAVDVTGWSVQYASSSGDSWQTTELAGTIESGEYYLVEQARGAGGFQALPDPDATGSIAMALGSGKVALVDGTDSLTGSCPLGATVDFVGFGGADCFEGSDGTPSPSNTTSAIRDGNGCVDTDDNATDFATGDPTPRNSESDTTSCDAAAETSPTGSGSADPASLLAGETTTLSVTVTPGTNPDSTGIIVSGDLSVIGGDANQSFTEGGDNVFTFGAIVGGDTSSGEKSIMATITDDEGRSSTTAISLIVESDAAPSDGVVISEFRVRGPNGGNDEFIELHNVGAAAVSIAGWEVWGSNASGNVGTTPRVAIEGEITLEPGCFYLVTNRGTSGGPYSGSVLGDQTYATGITDTGGIAILDASGAIVDQVGLDDGSAYQEGTPLASLGSPNENRSYERVPGGADGHTDTNDNATDFALIAPSNPQNSESTCIGGTPADTAPGVVSTTPDDGDFYVPNDASVSIEFSEPVDVIDGWYDIDCTVSGVHTASVSGGPTTFVLDPDDDFLDGDRCTVTIAAELVTDVDSDDPPDAMADDFAFDFHVGTRCTETTHVISEVQGDGQETTIGGESVIIRGVVTADFTSGGESGIASNQGLRGFFMEAVSDDRDHDPQTSEGVFVFDFDGTFDGEIGDVVYVAGTAGESFDVTQITSGEIDVCNDEGVDAELPPAAGLPLPVAPDDRATVLEPLESMRVTHEELTVIEFFQLERFGEIRLSAEGVLQTPTNVFLPGSEEAIELAEFNAAVNIVLDDGRTGENLNRLDSPDLLPYVEASETLRIGDQLIDHTTVLHFGFGQWRLQPVDIDKITEELATNRTRPRPENAPDVGGTLNVASFNVLNYFDGDGQGGGFPNARGATTASELERQTEKLVDAIIRLDADILGLIEIENDGGEFTATRTLVDAINAELGAEVYRFVDTGIIGTDAIKQAFIYDRRTVRPVGPWAILTSEIDPRFDDSRSRPALAQTFTQLGTGERVTVVVNHFKSKGQSGLSDETSPDFDQGDGQGFWNHTRTLSAIALADWLETNPTRVQSLGTLIIGDLNAYGREDPIRALEDAGYVDQLIAFTEGTPYTYTFDGQQGTLDTALAKGNLASRVTGADVWHINADEVPAIDYQESIGGPDNSRFRTPEIAEVYYDPSAFRSSDHDPVLVGLDLGRRDFPGPLGGPAR